MKDRKPLPPRRKPLDRGKPPRRHADPPQARSQPRRSSVSRRGSSLGEEERLRRNAVREAVLRRDRVCVLNPSTGNRRYLVRAQQLGVEHRCFGDRETMHHLKKASGLGEYTFENIVLLCAHGNTWVEDHPRLATQIGLVIR